MRWLLAWLGHWARWALPLGVFTGIALPQLASFARPALTAAVIGTLTVTILRLDWQRLAAAVAAPGQSLLLTGWQLVCSPLLVWLGCRLLDAPPALCLILLLQAAAPPIGSAAAFALFVGIDGSLTLVSTVLSTLLLPLTLTVLMALLTDTGGVTVDLGGFFVRVLMLVAAPFALAWLIRRLAGPVRLQREAPALGGLNVLLLVIFAVAVMDGVTATLLAEPATVATLLSIAVLMGVLLHLLPLVLFRRAGREAALGAALASGNRNMGLMLAVTGAAGGPSFALYVGLAQIPMYFAPLLLAPLARAVHTRSAR